MALIVSLTLGIAASSSAMAAESSTGVTSPPPTSAALANCSTAGAKGAPFGAMANAAVTDVSGGGRKYSYALPGRTNEYMTVSEPPPGFKPLTATDEELQRWGFPPRPSGAAGLQDWRELVGAYKAPLVVPSCRQTDKHRGYWGEKFNANWSGYEDVESKNQSKWHAIIGTFYQPYDHGSCGANAAVASWVGLGGDYTGRFMQAGTEALVGNRFNAWIEIYAGNYSFAYEVPNFPVEANAYMRLYVGYNRSLEIAYFYVTNDHTGQTVLTEWHLGPQFYDGSSAEWIDEAPYSGGGQLPLLNFNQINWYSDTVQNAQNQVLPIENGAWEKDVPWHDNNHRTSWPGAIWNGQNYTDFFYTCR